MPCASPRLAHVRIWSPAQEVVPSSWRRRLPTNCGPRVRAGCRGGLGWAGTAEAAAAAAVQGDGEWWKVAKGGHDWCVPNVPPSQPGLDSPLESGASLRRGCYRHFLMRGSTFDSTDGSTEAGLQPTPHWPPRPQLPPPPPQSLRRQPAPAGLPSGRAVARVRGLESAPRLGGGAGGHVSEWVGRWARGRTDNSGESGGGSDSGGSGVQISMCEFLNFIENVPTRADGLLTEESLVGAAVLPFPAAAGPAPGVAVAAGPTSTPGTCMRGV